MVLKSSIGNRALGWDLLPPGSESWEDEDPKTGKTYIHASKHYDDDVGNAKIYMNVGDAMGAEMVKLLKK